MHLLRVLPGTMHSETEEADIPQQVMVPILMFHDVKTQEGGTWSISADNFRRTLCFLLENGYTPISFTQLVDYVDGISDIPQKPVLLTLDDGYFSNYRNVLPILTEYNIPAAIFVIGSSLRQKGTTASADENALPMLSTAELKIMETSPLLQMQSHSYDLHNPGTPDTPACRDYALPLPTESESAFKEMFARDCALAEQILEEAGITEHLVYSYPAGKYHDWTEQVLREKGYRVTLTTDYSHRNLVIRGDPASLYLLGRMNVNDETTEENLRKYLERE